MFYEDLLSVPFKINGRDKDGMDCYGLCIELCRRNGTPLKDLLVSHVDSVAFREDVAKVNLREITEEDARGGDIVQCLWNGEIHIAFMLDKKLVIHMTTKGVRVNQLLSLINRKYFHVEEMLKK